MHDIRHLLLQFVDKLLRVVFLRFNIAQLLLPDTRQLAAFQQVLANQVNQFDTCRRGYQTLALTTDIVALEQRLDDPRTTRRTSDAVFLHGSTQGLVLYELTCRLHGTQ